MADAPQVSHTADGLQVNCPSDACKELGTDRTSDSHKELQPPPQSEFFEDSSDTSSHEDKVISKAVFGLRRQTFYLLVGLTSLIISAAVGGGIGGAVTAQRANAKLGATPTSTDTATASGIMTPAIQSSNSTSSTTSFVAPTALAITELGEYCRHNVYQSISKRYTFFCYNNSTLEVIYEGRVHGDIEGALIAYSVTDCIEACVTMNLIADPKGLKYRCTGVVFNSELSGSLGYPNLGGNCLLQGNATEVMEEARSTALRMCVDANCTSLIDFADWFPII